MYRIFLTMRRLLISFLIALTGVCTVYAAEISKTITVAQDGSGDYRTVGEAIKKLRGDLDEIVRIYIKNGTYHEKLLLNSTVNNVIIEGENPERTVITYSDYAGLNNMGTSGSYTFRVDGNNVKFKNLTIENGAGQVGQAVAIHTTGDKIVFDNCRFLGNQDTMYLGGRNGRIYCKDSYIEGTTDFIFGASTALFENCEIHGKINSYITAASTPADNPVGYVFYHCKVTTDPGVDALYLGRPWRSYASVYFVECQLPKGINPLGWHNWGKADNEKTARFGEYGNTGEGAEMANRVPWEQKLTAAMAKRLVNPRYIFARSSDWEPMSKE